MEFSSHILVCFTGAVTNRSEKNGPFYSGMGIASELHIPTVMVADTSVTFNNNSLAWYAGSKDFLNFQNEISQLLNKFGLEFDKKIIILGGSGGGFAGIACSLSLDIEAFVISMNPQTNIDNYYTKYVNDYLEKSFESLSKINFKGFFEKNNIVYDITKAKISKTVKILYLQNLSDSHHIDYHFSPFISDLALFPVGDNSYLYNNIGFYLGEWGHGHIPPSKKIIISIINLIIKSDCLFYVLRNMENGLKGLNPNSNKRILLTKENFTFKLNSFLDSNHINSTLKIYFRGQLTTGGEDLNFAIYVLDKHSNIISRHSYQKKVFKVPMPTGAVRIKLFIRDSFGRKVSILSNFF